MMVRWTIASISLPLCLVLPAQAADQASPGSATREVMKAQYAAQTKSSAMRPDEAQRIYENYLQSMGKPARDLSTNSGGSDPIPSR